MLRGANEGLDGADACTFQHYRDRHGPTWVRSRVVLAIGLLVVAGARALAAAGIPMPRATARHRGHEVGARREYARMDHSTTPTNTG